MTSEQGKDYLIDLNITNANMNTNISTNTSPKEDGWTGKVDNQDCITELDGDLLSVYGCPAIKYLERPWNKQRAQVRQRERRPQRQRQRKRPWDTSKLTESPGKTKTNQNIKSKTSTKTKTWRPLATIPGDISSNTSISVTNCNNAFQCDEKMKTVSSSRRSFHLAFSIFSRAFAVHRTTSMN